MATVHITVPGVPIAKGRPRSAVLKLCRKCGRKSVRQVCYCGASDFSPLSTITMTPKNTVSYENLIRMIANQEMKRQQRQPFEGAVELTMQAYFQIAATRRCKKADCLGRHSDCQKLHEGDPHLQRPDLDNIEKSALDGMSEVVFAGDPQVWKADTEKRWSVDSPRLEITING